PCLGIAFVLQAMSLAGSPPPCGFWGKCMISQEGFTQGEWVLVAWALVARALTLPRIFKVWLGTFWKAVPGDCRPVVSGGTSRRGVVVVGMACVSLVIGFGAETFVRVAKHAADETLARAGYAANVRAANDTVYPAKTPGAPKP